MAGISATYVSDDEFTVSGDYTTEFSDNRAVKANLDTDGIDYSYVSDQSYDSGDDKTTVTLLDDILTSNLSDVYFGVSGSDGEGDALPRHLHEDQDLPLLRQKILDEDYVRFNTGKPGVISPKGGLLTIHKDGTSYDGFPFDGDEPDLIECFYHVEETDSPFINVPCMGGAEKAVNPGYVAVENSQIKHYGTNRKVTTSLSDGSDQAYISGHLQVVTVDKTPDYDTGWTSVSAGDTKTHSHGLGTEPTILTLEVSPDSAGSGERVPCMDTSYFNSNTWWQSSIVEVDSNDIVARFHNQLYHIRDTSGSANSETSGYYRIKAWDWTPDFDSGWVPISTSEQVTLQHDLGKAPSLVWMYLGTTDDWTGDTLVALGQAHVEYNRGTHIKTIGENYIQVQGLDDYLAQYKDASGDSQLPTSGYIKVHAWY